jgi:Transposase IS4
MVMVAVHLLPCLVRYVYPTKNSIQNDSVDDYYLSLDQVGNDGGRRSNRPSAASSSMIEPCDRCGHVHKPFITCQSHKKAHPEEFPSPKSSSSSSSRNLPAEIEESSDEDDEEGDGIVDPRLEEAEEEVIEEVIEEVLPAKKKSKKDEAKETRANELKAIEESWEDLEMNDHTGDDTLPLPPRRHVLSLSTRQGVIPDHTKSPFDFFQLIWTKLFLGPMLLCTNLFGAALYTTKWTELSIPEFWRFTSIILYMGIVRQPEQRSYWFVDGLNGMFYGRSFVSGIMTRDRFMQIKRALHFIDVTTMDRNDRKEASKANAFYLMGDFITNLSKMFASLVTPGRGYSIDEMGIWFQGRHRAKCHNPSN